MQNVLTPLLNEEEPSLLSQLVHYAAKMSEPQLQALVKFLQKKQVVADVEALGNKYRGEAGFPLSFEELAILIEAAENDKTNAA
jgi:NADH:ubiquinone oxidoreductase subunit F (NADH-binding)